MIDAKFTKLAQGLPESFQIRVHLSDRGEADEGDPGVSRLEHVKAFTFLATLLGWFQQL